MDKMKELELKLLATSKELELKLLATSKELEEYKSLAKYNDKRFKDHLENCHCSREMKELENALIEKDDELDEFKDKVSANETGTCLNHYRIQDLESKLASQVVQIEILRNKAEVVEEELDLYDWRIDWCELFANGDLESAPFHTTSDLYCLSISVEYDEIDDSMEIYLHRCRDDDEVGRIPTYKGFDYTIYVVCNSKVVESNSGSLTDFSCFNIGRAYDRSRGFVCLWLSSKDVNSLRYKDFHIFCHTSTP